MEVGDLYAAGARAPGTHCVGPRADFEVLEEKLPCPYQESNHDFSVVQLAHRLHYPSSHYNYIKVKNQNYIIKKFPVITNFMLQTVNHILCNCTSHINKQFGGQRDMRLAR